MNRTKNRPLPSGRMSSKEAFIFGKDFPSSENMVKYIEQLDNDNQKYCNMWNQLINVDKEKNYNTIKAKLKEKIQKFIKI